MRGTARLPALPRSGGRWPPFRAGQGFAWLFLSLILWGGPALFGRSWDLEVLDRLVTNAPPAEIVACGDMDIRLDGLQELRSRLRGGLSPQNAFGRLARLWPQGIVPYAFSNNVSSVKQQAFRDAAAEWSTFANVRFVPRTAEANYVLVLENESMAGGRAGLGFLGGAQLLQIGPEYWSRATLCHELGHTLGLVHEHQRSDRNQFVTVITTNIVAGEEGNFVLMPDSINGGAYDFHSVMHYGRNALSVDPANRDTLRPLPAFAEFLDIMGNRFDPVLSPSDRAGVANAYGPGPVLTPVVTNTQDSGPGSLRAALYYALDHPGTTITFNIPPPGSDSGSDGGALQIFLTDGYPSLKNGTTVDGTTQPGAGDGPGPKIEIRGDLAQPPSVYAGALKMLGANSTLRSLAFHGFASAPIQITGPEATGNVVAGCHLGIRASGAGATNGAELIVIARGASENRVGGVNPGDRNVISCAAYYGLAIRDPDTRHNRVEGNYIGLNSLGTSALSNAWAGLILHQGAQSNTVGGLVPGSRNIISGNGNQGLVIADSSTSGNLIVGNYIGLNASGTGPVPNSWAGIDILGGASGNRIGGDTPAARNIISGNSHQGIAIRDPDTTHNTVQGNWIGLDPTGLLAQPNLRAGIVLSSGTRSNLIGGYTGSAQNVISGNSQQGVLALDPGTSGNVIAGNLIGLDAPGQRAVGNGRAGVTLFAGAHHNEIGGLQAGARNVISGNANQGITIGGPGTAENRVLGNWIGLNSLGTAAVSNAFAGLAIYGGAQANTVGGDTPAARNIISGNAQQGVVISEANTDFNTIAGNYIGTDPSGLAPLPNGSMGIGIFSGAKSNQIGGQTPGAGNILSANGSYGLGLSGTGTRQNLVFGNWIGVNQARVTGLSNTLAGIAFWGGAQSNLVGGLDPHQANLIAGNRGDGVVLTDNGTSFNTVRGNSIYNNRGAGISLLNGAAEGIAAPTLSSASVTTRTTVSGTFKVSPNAPAWLDFYLDSSSASVAEARIYLGSHPATADSDGNGSFAAELNWMVPAGRAVTGSVTDGFGNTSRLSAGVLAKVISDANDGIPNSWRTFYFSDTGTATNAASCASCDPDRDGLDNRSEWLAGTDPSKSGSSLALVDYTLGPTTTVSLPSVPGLLYRFEYCDDLSQKNWIILADNVPGTGAVLRFSDTPPAPAPRRFYRAGVPW